MNTEQQLIEQSIISAKKLALSRNAGYEIKNFIVMVTNSDKKENFLNDLIELNYELVTHNKRENIEDKDFDRFKSKYSLEVYKIGGIQSLINEDLFSNLYKSFNDTPNFSSYDRFNLEDEMYKLNKENNDCMVYEFKNTEVSKLVEKLINYKDIALELGDETTSMNLDMNINSLIELDNKYKEGEDISNDLTKLKKEIYSSYNSEKIDSSITKDFIEQFEENIQSNSKKHKK